MEINVTLSKYQKEKIRNAFCNREKILLRLKNDALSGSDTLLIPLIVVKKLEMTEIFYTIFIKRLESRRENGNKGMVIVLDYSSITDSTKDSFTQNIEKLI